MKPENRPKFRLSIVRVELLNREDHYRLQLETPTMDQHTIKQWSCAGGVPSGVYEDMLACLINKLAELVPHQVQGEALFTAG